MTAVGVAAAFVALPSALPIATASSPSPPFIAPDADWLTTVNYFRAMSGLGPVNEDPTLSTGAVKHSCYMLLNDITHYEEPSKPGYTVDGARAGRNGNVAVSSVFNTLDRSHIELWMTGPFHAIGLLRRVSRTLQANHGKRVTGILAPSANISTSFDFAPIPGATRTKP
jgi:uncharacterized protein YkwD